jgi:hypothetical protein
MKHTTLFVHGWAGRLCLPLVVAGAFAFTASQSIAAELLAGIAESGRLVLFASDAPEEAEVVQISGLQPDEKILGLDVRPLTGELYALGSSARLYTIDWVTGGATAIGAGPFTNALSGTSFGFDFNPTVDRIRIVSDSGLNLRVNPTNGLLAAIDGNLAYATNDSGAGLSPSVIAAAYINNDNNPATGTTLYDIDSERDVLVVQNPPNSGTLVTVGALGVDTVSVAGFDVASSDGTAYAALVPAGQAGNSQRAGLYTINLATGTATFLGKIGGPKALTSLATLGTIE